MGKMPLQMLLPFETLSTICTEHHCVDLKENGDKVSRPSFGRVESATSMFCG